MELLVLARASRLPTRTPERQGARPGHKTPPWAESLTAYATADKTPTDLTCVSRRNRASSNWVPNNKKKSGGSKRSGSRNFTEKQKRELLFAEDGQQYARVTTRLGDGRFEVLCFGDGVTRSAHVRGKLWKRVWVNQGDLVLVCLRAFQDQKTDIVHKFSTDEERVLQNAGELPKGAALTEDDPYSALAQAQKATAAVDGACRAGFFPDDDDFGWEVEGAE